MKFMHSIKKGLALVTLFALAIMALNLVALLAPTVANATTSATTRNVGPGQTYTTIQAAVNDAGEGDTIHIFASTYPENVTITSKTNLTIEGVGDTTIVQPASGIGFTIASSNGLTIKSLKIHTTGTSAHGIWVGGTASTGLTVQDNTIIVDGYSSGVYGGDSSAVHSGWLIGGVGHGNTITMNPGTGVTGDGMDLYDVSDSEVSYNTITLNTPTDSTNVIWSSELSDIANLTFSHNTCSGSSGSEVAFWANSFSGGTKTITGVTVHGNTFSNWGTRALRFRADTGSVTGQVVNANTFQMTTDTEAIGGNEFVHATGSGNTFNVGTSVKVQKAVDSAFNTDTIVLAAGTFNALGTTTVNKEVTIRSTAGTYNVAPANQTTITGVSKFSLDANNITLSGLIFEGVTDPIEALSPPTVVGVTISNNKLHNVAHVGMNIAGSTNMVITGNVIDGVTGLGDGMYISASTGLNINNNNIANCGYIGIVNDTNTNVTISKNTFYNIGSSGEAGFNLYKVNGATVSGNTMINAPINLIATTLTTGTINITNNTITNTAGPSAGKAILTDGTLAGATVNILRNNLAGNSYGVYNPGTVDINAIHNWWGSTSGPYNATSNPSGTGSSVTDNVTFDPWSMGSVIQYRAHVQGIGWQAWVGDAAIAGTTGQSRRMEAIQVEGIGASAGTSITYRAHVQGIGWQGWVVNGATAGTTGQSRRMEALEITLVNSSKTVYYRAHVQGIGWQGWVVNGATAGTTGQSRRMEALQSIIY